MAPTRDTTVEHVERKGHGGEHGRREKIAGRRIREIRHRAKNRRHAARCIAERKDIGEVHAANHREVPWQSVQVALHRDPFCWSGEPATTRSMPARCPGILRNEACRSVTAGSTAY